MSIYEFITSFEEGSPERRQAELFTGYEIVLNLDTGFEELSEI